MSEDLHFKSLRGVHDIFGVDSSIYDLITKVTYKVVQKYNYQFITLPILENINIFNKTLGKTSDIIEKEMYDFFDKGGNHIVLRPEFTASTVRFFLEKKLYKKNISYKFFTFGPVFRYNRPQNGRYRQFYQINFEHIGYKDIYHDVELIDLSCEILRNLNILEQTTLEINSLGCENTRKNYSEALEIYFKKNADSLSESSRKKIDINPISILDSKNTLDQEIISSAPKIFSYYSQESSSYLQKIQQYLKLLNIHYKMNPYLVRGLDYYSNIIFEFTTQGSKQQNTVLAGGRYDMLHRILGHTDIPSIGCAGGVERISALIKNTDKELEKSSPIYIICLIDRCYDYSISLAKKLRSFNFSVELNIGIKFEKQMRYAVQNLTSFIIFIGAKEIDTNTYTLKNLNNKKEERLTLERLLKFLQKNCPT